MHLWRWSGKYLGQIDPFFERVQPCAKVDTKRKIRDPYWQKRLCESCHTASMKQRESIGDYQETGSLIRRRVGEFQPKQ